jgi:hypothetical protein
MMRQLNNQFRVGDAEIAAVAWIEIPGVLHDPWNAGEILP